MRHAFLRPGMLLFAGLISLTGADEGEDIRQLKLKDWAPKPMLVVPEHHLEKPMFPAIDVHNHLGGGKQTLTKERVEKYLAEMDAAGVRTVVNLDGGWGDRLKETLAALDEAHPGRFVTFALINFDNIDDEGWTARETAQLEESFKAGAKGLKFHKTLGLYYRYKNGKLVPVDDPRLAPIFELCGKYKKPVMIHTSDPAAFFTPLDRFNERWHELNEHPSWLFYGDKFPPRDEVLAQFISVVEKHPQTTFIGAHFGNNVEDLALVGQWLDRYPNLNVDLDARISELGRQPYTAHKFFVKYQDRIMFGTDTTPRREAFRIYYRFLETEDEYFDCAASHHLQGFWRIYGIKLPREVLEKVYAKNAERIVLGQMESAPKTLTVRRTDDFTVTGDGSNAAWKKTEWEPLSRRGAGADYATRVKTLYSDRGLYVLMQGDDRKLTSTMKEDFADLWMEDVFEFFLWTDETEEIYFEYEISPMNYELPILVPNYRRRFIGWRPWHYEGDRKIVKATSAQGGKRESSASVSGWTAEIFLPFDLLRPLGNVPPKSGTRWRGNFYRMDYDDGRTTSWDWSRVGPSFHEFGKYGTLLFE